MTAEKTNLLLAAQGGDRTAEAKLLEQDQGLIRSVEKRFYHYGIDADDLHQLACLGYIKAVRGYDAAYKTEFSTYAVPKILGEIRRFLRDDGPIKISRKIYENRSHIFRVRRALELEYGREPTIKEIGEKTGLSMEEIAVCETSSSRIESLDDLMYESGASLHEFFGGGEIEEQIVLRESLRQAIAGLPDQMGQVICLRYQRNFTQAQTGKVLGVSQVQISRLEKRALKMLRNTIEQ